VSGVRRGTGGATESDGASCYAASLGDRQVTVFTSRLQPRFRVLRAVDTLDGRLFAARDFGRSKPETSVHQE